MVFGRLGRIGRTSGNKAARNCGYSSVVPDLTSSTTNFIACLLADLGGGAHVGINDRRRDKQAIQL